MKSRKNLCFLMGVALIGLITHRIYGLSDYAVVDSIHAYSNLTQADVDTWGKLLWMGSLAEPVATAAGAWGMYKGYKVGTYFGPSQEKLEGKELTPSQEKLKNIFESDIYIKFVGGYKPSETVQNVITSNWAWAGASAIGAGIAAYKLLRPRVQAGLWEKVRKFVALCERLAVTQYTYHNEQQFRQALNQKGNTIWVVGNSNPVAQKYGFEDLIEQANIALILIEQLENSISEKDKADLNSLRVKVITFQTNARNNYQFIANDLLREQQARSQQRSEYGKDLEIQSKEVGIAGKNIKNVTSQWKLFKDIAETTGSFILGILPEDAQKPVKKYGPITALGYGAYKAYQLLYAPNKGEKQETTP